MGAKEVKIWRIKTGQTTNLLVPVSLLGKLLCSDNPEVVSVLREEFGVVLCRAMTDVTRHGVYEQEGTGVPLAKMKRKQASAE